MERELGPRDLADRLAHWSSLRPVVIHLERIGTGRFVPLDDRQFGHLSWFPSIAHSYGPNPSQVAL